MTARIADIRKTYSRKKLLEKKALAHPIDQFAKWWKQATAAEIEEVNAMTLATVTPEGMPSARIVLLKDFSHEGFSFFTNYESQKGKQLAANPSACLVFFWKELERQVRITGSIEKLDNAVNDAYFHSRPVESQLGAVASPQSKVIESRDWLDDRFKTLRKEYHKKEVPRPKHWGGYLVKPVLMEFWQGRPGRLHDRLQYQLQKDGSWKLERLAP